MSLHREFPADKVMGHREVPQRYGLPQALWIWPTSGSMDYPSPGKVWPTSGSMDYPSPGCSRNPVEVQCVDLGFRINERGDTGLNPSSKTW